MFNEGARGLLNVCVFHFYGGRVQHPDQPYPSLIRPSIPPVQEQVRRWRAAAGNIPLIVTELGLYGQSATSGAHPNTGGIANNSGFTERQGIRDAVLFALLMRAGGATAILPHILPNSSNNPKDNSELSGYEFNDGIDPAKVRMKSKTRAFIDTLKLLENLTDAQIKELARLALSL